MITVYGPVVLGVNNQGRNNVLFSLQEPNVNNGLDGDIWYKYV